MSDAVEGSLDPPGYNEEEDSDFEPDAVELAESGSGSGVRALSSMVRCLLFAGEDETTVGSKFFPRSG